VADYVRRSTLLILLFFLFTGCGDQTKQIKEEQQLARSWASSVALIGHSWARRYTTTRFASKALERSKQAVEKEAQSFGSKKFQQEEAREVLASLKEIANLAGEMQSAVVSENGGALQKPLGELRQKQEQMKTRDEKDF
jgi:hypothetical protein